MNAYTLTAPELATEGLRVRLEKIATVAKEFSLATKTVLLFVGGPLLGLAFVIALPLVGFTLIAYYGVKLIAARWARIVRYVKNVALFLAAPFIGLAYMVAFPVIGVGALIYVGVKAVRR